MEDAFYDLKTGRTYINNEHLILAKAELKRKRKQEKLFRDLQAQQEARKLKEIESRKD